MRGAPASYMPASGFAWTGPYGGLQAAFGFGRGRTTDVGPDAVATRTNGGTFGAFAGYNHQFSNNVVAGLESDVNWANVSGGSTDSSGIAYSNKMNWFGSVRGRLGYAIGRALVFATGGVAFAGVDHTINDTPGTTTGLISFHDTQSGWTAGAGAEYAITDNLIARAEYRYYDFSGKTYGNTTAGGGSYFWYPHEFQARMQTVSAGLAVKF
ncbi:MAG: porin family protein [Hyphomicrobiales bacterium]|nr:porin family protein [Hyphomicrobiales bacterium]